MFTVALNVDLACYSMSKWQVIYLCNICNRSWVGTKMWRTHQELAEVSEFWMGVIESDSDQIVENKLQEYETIFIRAIRGQCSGVVTSCTEFTVQQCLQMLMLCMTQNVETHVVRKSKHPIDEKLSSAWNTFILEMVAEDWLLRVSLQILCCPPSGTRTRVEIFSIESPISMLFATQVNEAHLSWTPEAACCSCETILNSLMQNDSSGWDPPGWSEGWFERWSLWLVYCWFSQEMEGGSGLCPHLKMLYFSRTICKMIHWVSLWGLHVDVVSLSSGAWIPYPDKSHQVFLSGHVSLVVLFSSLLLEGVNIFQMNHSHNGSR